MKNMKHLFAGFVVGVILAIAPSCGGTKPCNSSTCSTGCCDAKGECQAGTSNGACGQLGGTCQICQIAQACSLGTCAQTNGNGGGSNNGGGSGGGSGGGTTGGGGGTTGGGGGTTGGGTGGGTTGGGRRRHDGRRYRRWLAAPATAASSRAAASSARTRTTTRSAARAASSARPAAARRPVRTTSAPAAPVVAGRRHRRWRWRHDRRWRRHHAAADRRRVHQLDQLPGGPDLPLHHAARRRCLPWRLLHQGVLRDGGLRWRRQRLRRRCAVHPAVLRRAERLLRRRLPVSGKPVHLPCGVRVRVRSPPARRACAGSTRSPTSTAALRPPTPASVHDRFLPAVGDEPAAGLLLQADAA